MATQSRTGCGSVRCSWGPVACSVDTLLCECATTSSQMYPEGPQVCICPPLSYASDFTEKPICLSSSQAYRSNKRETNDRHGKERERGGERAGRWRSNRERRACSVDGQMHTRDRVEKKMPSVSEENYHHGNDLPDTSTLTSAVILGRSARGG